MEVSYFYSTGGQNGVVSLMLLCIGTAISPELFFSLGILLHGLLSFQFLEAVRFALLKHIARGRSSAQIYSFILEP